MNISEAIDRVESAIAAAERGESQLTLEVLALEGMSSPKVRHFLSNVVRDENYLEVGCHRGSTFISAVFRNHPASAVAIDNWSQFSNTLNAREQFERFAATFIPSQFTQINEDCFSVDVSRFSQMFDIYMYDGDHETESHRLALTHFAPVLADTFVYIVDDWVCGGIVKGTLRAIEELGLKIALRVDLPAAHNGDLEQWWNGLGVFVLEKPRC